MNLCKEVLGKKFQEKKPGNKNSGKKFEFSEVLGKNVIGIKVLCFRFLRRFFPKIVWGAVNKFSGIKVRKKINPRKRKT